MPLSRQVRVVAWSEDPEDGERVTSLANETPEAARSAHRREGQEGEDQHSPLGLAEFEEVDDHAVLGVLSGKLVASYFAPCSPRLRYSASGWRLGQIGSKSVPPAIAGVLQVHRET